MFPHNTSSSFYATANLHTNLKLLSFHVLVTQRTPKLSSCCLILRASFRSLTCWGIFFFSLHCLHSQRQKTEIACDISWNISEMSKKKTVFYGNKSVCSFVYIFSNLKPTLLTEADGFDKLKITLRRGWNCFRKCKKIFKNVVLT